MSAYGQGTKKPKSVEILSDSISEREHELTFAKNVRANIVTVYLLARDTEMVSVVL